MKRLQGFSLMEMMIVLTIVAIVAAASAPMVNKKMVRAASEKSPWVFTNGESIGYNIDNENGIQDRKTATIGANGRVPNTGGNPRLYIDTNSDTTPHILFGRSSNNLMRLIAGGSGRNLWFSNQNIPAGLTSSVVLGQGAVANTSDATAIGANVNVSGDESVAIGRSANTTSDASVAIGERAQAGQDGINDINRYAAIAIGSVSKATCTRSIAIGRHAEAIAAGAIAMGSSANDVEATRARAMGESSIAIGQSALAQNNTSVAIGGTAQTSGSGCVAIGSGAQTGDNIVDDNMGVNRDNEPNKIAIGTNSFARKKDSIAIGNGAVANPNKHSPLWEPDAQRAIAIGSEAQAFGTDAIAIGNKYRGKNTLADTGGAIALGTPSQATGVCAIAIGGATSTSANTTTASGRTSAAIGIGAQATAENSVSIGTSATASGSKSIAIGRFAVAMAENSVAIGSGAQATTKNTIVLGNSDSSIYIPGNLVVGKVTFLGRDLHVCGFPGRGRRSALFMRFSTDAYKMRQIYEGKHGDDSLYSVDSDSSSLMPSVSDRRLKNVGKEFTSGLDKIKKLEIFNYTFKDDKEKTPHVGVIAQDLQKIFPDAVVKGEDGFLRIRMEDMFYAVINAVKELDTRTSAQEKKIQELEKRIEELEKLVKQS